MCGIAALFAATARPLSPLLVGMTRTIAHRGPDDEGYWLRGADGVASFHFGDDTPAACRKSGLPYAPRSAIAEAGSSVAGLAHRRLSILDLSAAGHQPMSSPEGDLTLVYNGEIYNYLELRQVLERDWDFVSRSDTEVILAAYRRWGVDCLERFNGMFAFVLFDARSDTVFAARDRFGVKPLYFWSDGALTAFASEIKQFTVLPGWAPRLNRQSAYDYLNWGLTDHSGATLFEGVRQLRGGEYLHCRRDELHGVLRPRRWYELRAAQPVSDFDAAVEEFRHLFDDAVRLRLRSDVAVGTALSGGLDSSSIVTTIAALLRESGDADARQMTFSARSDYAEFDEGRYIDAVVEKAGVDARHVHPQRERLFDELPRITWHQDEPFGSTSIFAEWCVFDLVRASGVKVTLDGHGADEQLAGYHAFFPPFLTGLLTRGQWIRLVREMQAMTARHGYNAKYLIQRMAAQLLPRQLNERLRAVSGHAVGVLPDWMDTAGIDPRSPYLVPGLPLGTAALSRKQLLETSLPLQLHWADRDSMAHSVESRIPFLDYRLVEFLLGCPDEHKIGNGVTKRILRSAMVQRLPDAVQTRSDKMGFVTPEERWVRDEQPQQFKALVRRSVERSGGVLKERAIARADAIIDGKVRYDFWLWRVISFGEWMDAFSVRH